MTTTNEEVIVDTETNEVESGTEESNTISIPKSDYEKLNQTLGSMKRELKDLKKSKDDSKETTKQTEPDNRILERMEKLAFKTAGISHEDDVALAKQTAKKWGMDVEDVLGDDDFKLKLERQQTSRNNIAATSGIKGGAGTSQAKNTPEYWVAKGTPPTAADVPDRKVRAKIARAMMSNAKSSKQFYNS